MNAGKTRLWLALRFRGLPLTVLEIADPELPTAVIDGQRVKFTNPAAAAVGVQPGMDVTTAQLLGARTVARNFALEQTAIEDLCEQLYQFTPHIARYSDRGEPGLVLEVSTCLQLFAGLPSFMQLIQAFLDGLPYGKVDLALGHTAEAAWLLSRHGYPLRDDELLVSPQLYIDRLNALPITDLESHPTVVERLVKSGFCVLGDIARQAGRSFETFTRRFGIAFTEYIQDVYGGDQGAGQGQLFAKPVVTFTPAEIFTEEVQFEYPVSSADQLHLPMELLLQQLATFLRTRQRECQRIEWQLMDITRRIEAITVSSDIPQMQWPLLYDLTLTHLEGRELPFEVDTLRLICDETNNAQGQEQTFSFTQVRRRRGTSQKCAHALAKLKARLGESAVYKVSYQDARLPEHTNRLIGTAEKSLQALSATQEQGLRPTWLFSTPAPIKHRGDRLYWRGYLSLLTAPERMVGDWWEESIVRDYFLARRQDNLRVWIYMDLHTKQWFVHGIFA